MSQPTTVPLHLAMAAPSRFGFTMIELAVAIAILIIVASLFVSVPRAISKKAVDEAASLVAAQHRVAQQYARQIHAANVIYGVRLHWDDSVVGKERWRCDVMELVVPRKPISWLDVPDPTGPTAVVTSSALPYEVRWTNDVVATTALANKTYDYFWFYDDQSGRVLVPQSGGLIWQPGPLGTLITNGYEPRRRMYQDTSTKQTVMVTDLGGNDASSNPLMVASPVRYEPPVAPMTVTAASVFTFDHGGLITIWDRTLVPVLKWRPNALGGPTAPIKRLVFVAPDDDDVTTLQSNESATTLVIDDAGMVNIDRKTIP